MKVLITFIFIFLFSSSLFAQKITWLDVSLKEVNQLNSVYYKVVSKDGKKLNYFFKSGKLFREIIFLNSKELGTFSEFYETGELRTSGKYENNLEEGIWKTYYKNGKIKEKGKYKKGEKVGIWKSFYKNF